MQEGEFSIYQGTVRIAFTPPGLSTREAWRTARAYVRAMAHADGVEGQERIYSTAGRPGAIDRGIYHATLTRRVDC